MKRAFREGYEAKDVPKFVNDCLGDDVHGKGVSARVGTTGVLASGSLAISAIGFGLSHACGTGTSTQ